MRVISLLITLTLISCWNGKVEKTEKKTDSDHNQPGKIVLENEYSLEKIINKIKERKIPLIDSTNFDNFKSTDFYNVEQLKILQIKKIYPEIDNEIEYESTNKDGKPPYTYYSTKNDFKVASSYKLNISDKFKTIVLATFKGEHEIESSIINYDLEGSLIDFKVISYDEIAEGAFRIETKIEQNKLTISNIVWFDEKFEEKEEFKIDQNGKIKPVANTVYKK